MRTYLLIEDDLNRAEREPVIGVSDGRHGKVRVRVHEITNSHPALLAEKKVSAGRDRDKERKRATRRSSVALQLLDQTGPHASGTVVIAGASYGCNQEFLKGLAERKLEFAVELRPSSEIKISGKTFHCRSELTRQRRWARTLISHPTTKCDVEYSVAEIAHGTLAGSGRARLFAVQKGRIKGIHRDSVLVLTSLMRTVPGALLNKIGWVRWIRPFVRKGEREKRSRANPRQRQVAAPSMPIRTNIATARQQDVREVRDRDEFVSTEWRSRRSLESVGKHLNVVELFAGAGGMGLGFLLSSTRRKGYRIIYSAEVNPIYVKTLAINHDSFSTLNAQLDSPTPGSTHAVDLRCRSSLEEIKAVGNCEGGVHVLIGGPPCQGFSSANRNSWHGANPHNQHVDTFFKCVEELQPLIFLMENVQGILWTPSTKRGSTAVSVADYFANRIAKAGYLAFPKLLDAVWYGVPQHRNRFFLLGIRSDLGYSENDFGTWGPFPLPTHGPGRQHNYVTVRDAIADLPRVPNGCSTLDMRYKEADERGLNDFLRQMRIQAHKGVVHDHVTSRHSDYVINRYSQIPQGGNWEDIAHDLTNYADVARTHSNIYRRLTWKEPSITIGHYRKSMLVHPSQDRGLSLREASRLQSFPDWFRFAGSADGDLSKGLMHKQQQLANAVCPLVTKAVAEFLLRL